MCGRDWSSDVCSSDLIEKLDATDLPAVSRKRLAEAYKPGDDFDAAIAAEVEYFKQVQESVKPEGKGHDTNTGTGTGTVREAAAGRSEERRVGKECRSRWSPEHEEKKRKSQNAQ